jgi:predicted PurR-regulated permease PerM
MKDMELVKQGRFSHFRGVFLIFVGAVLVWLLGSFLKPLAMGAIFATVLYPMMNVTRLGRFRRLSPSIRAGIITIGFTFAFLIPFSFRSALMPLSKKFNNFPDSPKRHKERSFQSMGLSNSLV